MIIRRDNDTITIDFENSILLNATQAGLTIDRFDNKDLSNHLHVTNYYAVGYHSFKAKLSALWLCFKFIFFNQKQ